MAGNQHSAAEQESALWKCICKSIDKCPKTAGSMQQAASTAARSRARFWSNVRSRVADLSSYGSTKDRDGADKPADMDSRLGVSGRNPTTRNQMLCITLRGISNFL